MNHTSTREHRGRSLVFCVYPPGQQNDREHRGRSLVFCVYPPGQQNDRGKRWHCKEIQQLGDGARYDPIPGKQAQDWKPVEERDPSYWVTYGLSN